MKLKSIFFLSNFKILNDIDKPRKDVFLTDFINN